MFIGNSRARHNRCRVAPRTVRIGSKVLRNASTFVSRSALTVSSVAPRRFSRLAEVRAVLLVKVRQNVGDNQPQNPTDQNAIRPGVDKLSDRAASLTTKQRRPICMSVLEIGRNYPRIENT